MVLVGTKRLYELFTNGGRKSRDLEQLWSRVGIHDLLPGLDAGEIRRIASASFADLNHSATLEIQRVTGQSTRCLMKLIPRIKRLQTLNPSVPTEKLIPKAAGQIIS